MNGKGRALLLVGAVLLVGITWLLSQQDPGSQMADVGEGDGPRDGVASVGPTPESAEARESIPLREAVVERAEPNRDAGAGVEAATEPLAGLAGRFLLPGGRPAVGVRLSVHGWGGNQERVLKHGVPESWEDPLAETGPDGRFLIEFDPPRAFQFTLSAQLAGYVEVSWRWSGLSPGKLKDLGTIELQRGGTIEGRIVDADGRSVPGRWRVYANSVYRPAGDGGDNNRVSSSADSVTGAFRLENLPAGRIELRAQSDMANSIAGPVVEMAASEVVTVDIVYEGEDLSNRVTVSTFNHRFYTYTDPAPGSLILRGAEGFEAPFAHLEGSSQTHIIDGVPSGSYTVRLDDPRFKPFSKTGVQPGNHVSVYLSGNAAIEVTVLDDATGNSIEAYRLRVRMDESNSRPNEFELRSPRDKQSEGGLYDELIPETQTFLVDAEGYSTGAVTAENLAPNEARALTVRLSRGARVAGRATQGRRPAIGLPVALFPHIEIPDQRTDPNGHFRAVLDRQQRIGWLEAKTALDDGGFLFENVAYGIYDLTVTKNEMVTTTMSAIPIREPAPPEIVVELPAEGTLRGRILGPPGAIFEGLAVQVVAVDEAAGLEPWKRSREPILKKKLDVAGMFEIEGIATGLVRVFLKMADSSIPHGSGMSTGVGGKRLELGSVEIRPDEIADFEYDLSDRFPGRLLVTVRVEGEHRNDLVLLATELNERGARVGGRLGDEDPASFGPVPVGFWRLMIRPIDVGWWYAVPNQFSVGPASVVPVTVSIDLLSGQLTLRDADTGDPLIGRHIQIQSLDSPESWILAADENGSLSMELPEGTYEIRHWNRSSGSFRSKAEATLLHWRGPSPPTSIDLQTDK